MKSFATTLSMLILSAAASVIGREVDLEKPSSKLRRFASDVIFEVEAGDREKYSKRIPEALIVSYYGQAVARPTAEKHLAEFLQLTGVKRIDKAVEGQRSATMGIYFGSQAELAKAAREIDRQITIDRGFSYWTWWDQDRTIKRAVVMVATDKVTGAALEDRFIELLLGAFGLPARSDEFSDSCLSSEEPVLTTLQPVDKALLEFYYRAVPAGTKPRDFDKLFRAGWGKKRQSGAGD